jgi:predicted dinucleotide-binding enzyme
MKIGFIGSGNIGGAIGELLAKAGTRCSSPRATRTT